jgi:hypothetical protein
MFFCFFCGLRFFEFDRNRRDYLQVVGGNYEHREEKKNNWGKLTINYNSIRSIRNIRTGLIIKREMKKNRNSHLKKIINRKPKKKNTEIISDAIRERNCYSN